MQGLLDDILDTINRYTQIIQSFSSKLIGWPPKNLTRTYSLTLPPRVLTRYGFDPASFQQTPIMSTNQEYK